MIITSRQNPLVKSVIALGDKKARKERGLYLVEGIKPVSECLSAGFTAEKIFATPKFAEKFPQAVIVDEGVFKAMSSEAAPQGVLATVKIPENKLLPPQGNCLLLDNLQDPGNLGTIIRTANAAGYGELYLINCADPYSPKAVRASMSGIFFVTIRQGGEKEVLNALEGTPIICADMAGENIFSYRPPQKICLGVGNEGNGLSKSVISASAATVSIPMRSGCESLNAAISAAIAMYALKNNQKEN